MRLIHSIYLAAAALCSSAVAWFTLTADRFVAAAFSIAPPGPELAFAGSPETPLSIVGQSVARSIVLGGRHEAGTARRAAARGI